MGLQFLALSVSHFSSIFLAIFCVKNGKKNPPQKVLRGIYGVESEGFEPSSSQGTRRAFYMLRFDWIVGQKAGSDQTDQSP